MFFHNGNICIFWLQFDQPRNSWIHGWILSREQKQNRISISDDNGQQCLNSRCVHWTAIYGGFLDRILPPSHTETPVFTAILFTQHIHLSVLCSPQKKSEGVTRPYCERVHEMHHSFRLRILLAFFSFSLPLCPFSPSHLLFLIFRSLLRPILQLTHSNKNRLSDLYWRYDLLNMQ